MASNSIVINAIDTDVTGATASGLFIAPIASGSPNLTNLPPTSGPTGFYQLWYNPTTSEIKYVIPT
jgi:hypothetical protein